MADVPVAANASQIWKHTYASGSARVLNGNVTYRGPTSIHNIQNTIYLHEQRSFKISPELRINAADCLLRLESKIKILQCLAAKYDASEHESPLSSFDTGIEIVGSALNALRKQLDRIDPGQGYASKLSLEDMVASLTNAVRLFDDVHGFLMTVEAGERVKVSPAKPLCERLSWQADTWNLQASILLAQSSEEATTQSARLADRITGRLAQDPELRQRMNSLEDETKSIAESIHFDAAKDAQFVVQPGSIRHETAGGFSDAVESQPRHALGPSGFIAEDVSRPFEIVLNGTRVYERFQNGSEQLSSHGSVYSSQSSWSSLSNLTFDHISILAVIALPIRIGDLRYGDCYASTNNGGPPSGELSEARFYTDKFVRSFPKTVNSIRSVVEREIIAFISEATECLADFGEQELRSHVDVQIAHSITAFRDMKQNDRMLDLSGWERCLASISKLDQDAFANHKVLLESALDGARACLSLALIQRLTTRRRYRDTLQRLRLLDVQPIKEQYLRLRTAIFCLKMRLCVPRLLNSSSREGHFIDDATVEDNGLRALPEQAIHYVLAQRDVRKIHWDRFPKHTMISRNLLPRLGLCSTLTNLTIRNQGYSEVPATILELSQLTALDLSSNEISKLPDISPLQSLRELRMDDNKLEVLPESITEVATLEILLMDANRIKGLPERMDRWSNLQTLSLHRNRITALPDSMNCMTCLSHLDISFNSMVIFPEVLGQMQYRISPRELNLSHTKLVSLPKGLKLQGLRALKLAHNGMTKLPDVWDIAPELETLDMSRNLLKCLPTRLAGMKCLHDLNVRNNGLKSIPTWLSDMQSLLILNVSGNKLKRLPTCLGDMQALIILRVADNPVTPVLDRFEDEYDPSGDFGHCLCAYIKHMLRKWFESAGLAEIGEADFTKRFWDKGDRVYDPSAPWNEALFPKEKKKLNLMWTGG